MKENIKINKFLNEATYYGRNEFLIQAEKILDEIIKESKIVGFSVAYQSEKFKKVFNILEKLFNFEKIEYYITSSDSLHGNASTLPITYRFGVLSKTENYQIVENSKYGLSFKDKKGKILILTIYEEYFNNPNITGSSLLAIILHEIGHNFYLLKTFKNEILTLEILMDIYDDISRLLLTRSLDRDKFIAALIQIFKDVDALSFMLFGKSYISYIKNYVTEKFPIIQTIKKFVALTGIPEFIISTVFITYKFTIPIILNLPLIFLYNIKKFIITNFINDGYTHEKFADNFARSYGYESDTQFLSQTLLSKIEILSLVDASSRILSEILVVGRDVHPSNDKRLQLGLSYFQSVLDENKLSAKERKFIKNMIDIHIKAKNRELDHIPWFEKIMSSFPLKYLIELQDTVKDIIGQYLPSLPRLLSTDKNWVVSNAVLNDFSKEMLEEFNLKDNQISDKEIVKRIYSVK